MAKLNRESLKNYFASGERPSGEYFANLIDSTVNILDDDFSERSDEAIKVAGDGEQRAVISILKESGDKESAWEVAIEKEGDLSISQMKKDKEFRSSLVFKNSGDMELKAKDILVNGVRKWGTEARYPADGNWNDITEELEGCDIIEITAIYNSPSGKHNTLLAWASHCSGKKKKIKRIRPCSFFWNNKLKIRWVKIKDKTNKKTKGVLQLRTRYNSGSDSYIKCTVTHLHHTIIDIS